MKMSCSFAPYVKRDLYIWCRRSLKNVLKCACLRTASLDLDPKVLCRALVVSVSPVSLEKSVLFSSISIS